MSDKPTSTIELPLPDQPFGDTPYQGGITDPMWPASYCEAIAGTVEPDPDEQPIKTTSVVASETDADDEEQAIRVRYAAEYSGRVARQEFLTILRSDIQSTEREELRAILKLMTRFIVEEVEKHPSEEHISMLERIPRSYRVTITLGFGASLFVDADGRDRFGLRALKPRFLKPMPSFPGDADKLAEGNCGSDLILLIASDHPYVNTGIARLFGEYFNKRFREEQGLAENRNVLRFFPVQQGFGRKDKREFLRFDDGIQNLQMDREDLLRLVYVGPADSEPDWCWNGSYMVYRKIRENMPVWEAFADATQEKMIGREKVSGLPLSRGKKDAGDLTPVYASHTDPADGPLNAHIRKVQPRRNTPDLFGVDDLERRFLRRPYPFFDGLDESGRSSNGLHFVAFMKNIQQQFEHVTNMWQMNPDFPVPDTGIDVLYGKDVLATVDGGYYFCPPGLKGKQKGDDFLGSELFA